MTVLLRPSTLTKGSYRILSLGGGGGGGTPKFGVDAEGVL